MGHIFISYSHRDTKYAHRLAEALQGQGLDVWIDERLDYGSQWPHEIQKQLDSCDAFIVIMSPRAFQSEWVQSELQRAKRKLKPIFPLLLEGDEPWLSVESTQYYDVRGGKLPDAKFFSAIERVVPPAETPVRPAVGEAKTSRRSYSSIPARKPNLGIIAAVVGGIAILAAVAIPLFRSAFSQKNVPLPTTEATSVDVAASTEEMTKPALTPASTVSENPDAPSDFVDEKGVPMRLVPAREFTMGSRNVEAALAECQQYFSDCDRSWFDDETAPHTVFLDAFYMDVYEVTNGRYAECVQADVCGPPTDTTSDSRSSYYGNSEFDDYPVIFIGWDMAKTYCEWRGARLPTEAEWEKAARGTDERLYPWGEEIDDRYANYNNNRGDTAAVGGYDRGKSPYGLSDMAGNVWEWVADYYSVTYYHNSPSSNPQGPESGGAHVLRGGSWSDPAFQLRTTIRLKQEDPVNNNFGFRCAKDATP